MVDKGDMSGRSMSMQLIDGNPGALSIMMKLGDHVSGTLEMIHLCKTMINKDIIGSKMWEIYKDKCSQDMDTFVDHIHKLSGKKKTFEF